jgi:hypothetical protein
MSGRRHYKGLSLEFHTLKALSLRLLELTTKLSGNEHKRKHFTPVSCVNMLHCHAYYTNCVQVAYSTVVTELESLRVTTKLHLTPGQSLRQEYILYLQLFLRRAVWGTEGQTDEWTFGCFIYMEYELFIYCIRGPQHTPNIGVEPS